MELSCIIQNYEWGKKGIDSIVGQLAQNTATVIKCNIPYAELWLGTHPNGPSCIKETKQPLLTYIQENPELHLGSDITKTFGTNLPYLLKVLSVGSPLSIQAHPNKEHAKRLHASQPTVYKDTNHKPELAIAMGDFKALCGFRPFTEIQSLADALDTMIQPLFGVENFEKLQKGPENPDIIKSCLTHLLRQKKETIQLHVDTLLSVIDNGKACSQDCSKKPGSFEDPKWLEANEIPLLRQLNNLYPGDPGCVVIYLLNVMRLKRFEAIFLAANVPHAYLLGDCVEIMACSDNVIRAGLTPKRIDIEILIEMLDYTSRSSDSLIFTPTRENDNTAIYRPPIQDFAIAQIQIGKGTKYDLIKRSTASIVLILEGDGTTTDDKIIKAGMSFFLSANDTFQITSTTTDMLIFQAMANV